MKRAEYPREIQQLIASLRRLPGIGPRSAERMALVLLQSRDGLARDLAEAIRVVSAEVTACPRCGFFQSGDRACGLCHATDRDPTVLCVIEQPSDILSIERSGAFRGQYHVLGGKISPLNNIGPDDLRIDSLVRRLALEPITEIILAIGSDVEGEATAHYLSDALAGRPDLRITRLAQGLPAGGGLDHIDDLTLQRALSGRRAL